MGISTVNPTRPVPAKPPAARLLVAAAWLYLAALAGWFALSRTAPDTPGYLGLLTSLGHFLFLPLPLVAGFAAVTRRRLLGAGVLGGIALFAFLWGPLFLPRVPGARAAGPTLTVMTWNGLGRNDHMDDFLDAIRREDADVVCLQELSLLQSQVLDTEFAAVYPYRLLEPRTGVRGMGILSRYPLRELPSAVPSEWNCVNQTAELSWDGRAIQLVNFHLLPFPEDLRQAGALTQSFVRREREAVALTTWIHTLAPGTPVIAAGDANAASTNRVYRVLTSMLTDAWREAGFGFGHTFPDRGAANHGGIRRIGFEPPSWLVRIDYVFHSPSWHAVRARTAASAGGSDHRGVIAELRPPGPVRS